MIWKKNRKPIIPLLFSYYFFPLILIILMGLRDSIYLILSHYRVYTDIGYRSFSAISRPLNCDTLSQCFYSILAGVRVPVWGMIGYLFFLVLPALAWPEKAVHSRVWTLLILMSMGFSIYSLILATIISTFYIKSYCIICILIYKANLMLLYFTWLIRNRFQCEPILHPVVLNIRYLLYFPKIVGMDFSDYQCFQYQKMKFSLLWMIQAWLHHNLTSPPIFVINETVYKGQIPADVFREHGLSGTGKTK